MRHYYYCRRVEMRSHLSLARLRRMIREWCVNDELLVQSHHTSLQVHSKIVQVLAGILSTCRVTPRRPTQQSSRLRPSFQIHLIAITKQHETSSTITTTYTNAHDIIIGLSTPSPDSHPVAHTSPSARRCTHPHCPLQSLPTPLPVCFRRIPSHDHNSQPTTPTLIHLPCPPHQPHQLGSAPTPAIQHGRRRQHHRRHDPRRLHLPARPPAPPHHQPRPHPSRPHRLRLLLPHHLPAPPHVRNGSRLRPLQHRIRSRRRLPLLRRGCVQENGSRESGAPRQYV